MKTELDSAVRVQKKVTVKRYDDDVVCVTWDSTIEPIRSAVLLAKKCIDSLHQKYPNLPLLNAYVNVDFDHYCTITFEFLDTDTCLQIRTYASDIDYDSDQYVMKVLEDYSKYRR